MASLCYWVGVWPHCVAGWGCGLTVLLGRGVASLCYWVGVWPHCVAGWGCGLTVLLGGGVASHPAC